MEFKKKSSFADNTRKSSMIDKRKVSIQDKQHNYSPKIKPSILMNDEFIYNLLSKNNKNLTEIKIVRDFLERFSDFVNGIKETSEDYNEILSKIAVSLKYEFIKSNNVLFHYGDSSINFYLILNGKLSVIVPNEINFHLNEEEYYDYLLNLRLNREIEVLKKCLTYNNGLFESISELNKWLECSIERYEKSEIEDSVIKKLRKKGISKEFLEKLLITMTEKANFNQNPISPDAYCLRLKPRNNLLNLPSKSVKIFIFSELLVLKTGDKFGDFAFSDKENKRKATIIAVENSHFGALEKHSYELILKKANEMSKKNTIHFFTSNQIFHGLEKDYFLRKYFGLFICQKIKINSNLVSQGDLNDQIYFIRKGTYEVSIFSTIEELEKILLQFSKNTKIDNENQNESFNENQNGILKKKHFKFSIINTVDVVGFEDMLIDNKYIFTVKSTSITSEVFKIKKNILEKIFEKEKFVMKNKINFVKIKTKFLIERLKSLIEMTKKQMNTIKLEKNQSIGLEKIKALKKDESFKKLNMNYSDFICNLNEKQEEILDRCSVKGKNYFDFLLKSKIQKKIREKLDSKDCKNKNSSSVANSNLKAERQELLRKFNKNEKDLNEQLALINKQSSKEKKTKKLKKHSSLFDMRSNFETKNLALLLNEDKTKEGLVENFSKIFKKNEKSQFIDCLAMDSLVRKTNYLMFGMNKTAKRTLSSFNLFENLVDEIKEIVPLKIVKYAEGQKEKRANPFISMNRKKLKQNLSCLSYTNADFKDIVINQKL